MLTKPEPIGSIIDSFLKRRGLSKKIKQHQLWEIWAELVGQAVAKEAAPLRIQRNMLVVEVTNSAWMQELVFLKPRILAKIKDSLPEAGITDIRFEIRAAS